MYVVDVYFDRYNEASIHVDTLEEVSEAVATYMIEMQESTGIYYEDWEELREEVSISVGKYESIEIDEDQMCKDAAAKIAETNKNEDARREEFRKIADEIKFQNLKKKLNK